MSSGPPSVVKSNVELSYVHLTPLSFTHCNVIKINALHLMKIDFICKTILNLFHDDLQ